MNEPLTPRAAAIQSGNPCQGGAISEREAGRREVLTELARRACAMCGTNPDRTPGIAWLVRLGEHFDLDVDSMLATQPKVPVVPE